MVIKFIWFSTVLPLCSVFRDVLGGNEIDHTVIKAHCHLFHVPSYFSYNPDKLV